nr:hypothetical protein [Pseudomonas sp.]
MKGDVTVNFGRGQILEFQARCDASNVRAPAAAQQWLEKTYTEMGCEPVRLSGKVLLLDRVLAIAIAAGYEGLRDNPELAEAFACNTVLAIGHPRVTIDVPGLTVGY